MGWYGPRLSQLVTRSVLSAVLESKNIYVPAENNVMQ
jgi:hypothetical protein